MKLKTIQNALFFICLICYYFFFWEEKFGLNLFIFNALLMAFIYLDFKAKNKIDKTFLWLCFANLIAVTSVLILNTDLSKLVYFISLFMVIGFTIKPDLRLFHKILLHYIIQFFKSILQFFTPIKLLLTEFTEKVVNKNKYLSMLKITLIPLLILSLFYLIFHIANPIFQEFNAVFLDNIRLIFKNIPNFSFLRLLFLLGGYYFLITVFYKERSDTEVVILNDYIKKEEDSDEKSIDNKYFQTGLLTFLLVNILLLFINFIDIKYLWFGEEMMANEKLSGLVHTSTYMLILSILLSMAIILYFFKNELNFHIKIKQLRVLAFCWIIQNVVLAISVMIRNAKYIEQFGLTYKRIGIFIFLFLTAAGLLTLVFKIKQIRSFYYLLKTNTWLWYGVFIFLACLDIDRIIVHFNIKNSEKIAFDFAYASELSVRTAPIVIDAYKDTERWGLSNNSFNSNVKLYHRELKTYSWLSWNKADSDFMNAK